MRVAAAVAVAAVLIAGIAYGAYRQASDPSCTPVRQSRADRFCVPSWKHPASIATAAAGIAIAAGLIAYRRFKSPS